MFSHMWVGFRPKHFNSIPPLFYYLLLSAAAAAAKSLQSCPTLCDPIEGSPPGSPVPGILQARTLEWVPISFSNAWNWKVKVKSLSRVRLFATPWTAAHQAVPSMGFSRQEYWSGVPLPSPLLLSIISQIFVYLCFCMLLFVAKSWQCFCNPVDCSPSGSSVHGISLARILEWIAISFSRRSPQPRDWTHVSCFERQILYRWINREAPLHVKQLQSIDSMLLIFSTSSSCFHQHKVTRKKIWKIISSVI